LMKNKSTLHFKIKIDAPAKRVYDCMLDPKKYGEWTAVFNGSSRFEGSWEKGSKIIFIGTEEDGTTMGMYSRIKENIPAKFESIEHLGIIKTDEEINSGPEAEKWAGGMENYSFKKSNGRTELQLDVDSPLDFKEYFEMIWPKALR